MSAVAYRRAAKAFIDQARALSARSGRRLTADRVTEKVPGPEVVRAFWTLTDDGTGRLVARERVGWGPIDGGRDFGRWRAAIAAAQEMVDDIRSARLGASNPTQT